MDSAARLAVDDAIADASAGVHAAVEAAPAIEVAEATGVMDAAVEAAPAALYFALATS